MSDLDDLMFTVPQASLRLSRYPEPEINLRAWNAADGYLLEWLAEHRVADRRPCCVVNDAFGALTLALAVNGDREVVSWSDSWIAHAGAQANAVANDISTSRVHWARSTERPTPPPPDSVFGLVVVKVPKSLDHLRLQLRDLVPVIVHDTVVVAGAMTKHVHSSTIECFDSIIGPAATSLARRKARLIFAEPATDRAGSPDGQDDPVGSPTFSSPSGLTFVADPAVFSGTRIDAGTALLLDAVQPAPHTSIVDMGCGIGVIGITMLERQPDLTVTFTDESYRAVAASRASLTHNIDNGMPGGPLDRHRFVVDDCGSTIPDASVDLVCINPPFHDAAARTTAIAERMFDNAARMLRPGGSVVVVANRHLNHHATLRRWFAKPTVLASDRRFVVLQAHPR